MKYRFNWDPHKARSNLGKHGVSFEWAAGVFADPMALTIFDGDASGLQEERWVTLGQVNGHHYLVVVHTFKEESRGVVNIRLISARKATKHEIQQYENG